MIQHLVSLEYKTEEKHFHFSLYNRRKSFFIKPSHYIPFIVQFSCPLFLNKNACLIGSNWPNLVFYMVVIFIFFLFILRVFFLILSFRITNRDFVLEEIMFLTWASYVRIFPSSPLSYSQKLNRKVNLAHCSIFSKIRITLPILISICLGGNVVFFSGKDNNGEILWTSVS